MFPALYYKYKKLARVFCGCFGKMLFQVGRQDGRRIDLKIYMTFSTARLLVGGPQLLKRGIVNGVYITKISGRTLMCGRLIESGRSCVIPHLWDPLVKIIIGPPYITI